MSNMCDRVGRVKSVNRNTELRMVTEKGQTFYLELPSLLTLFGSVLTLSLPFSLPFIFLGPAVTVKSAYVTVRVEN